MRLNKGHCATIHDSNLESAIRVCLGTPKRTRLAGSFVPLLDLGILLVYLTHWQRNNPSALIERTRLNFSQRIEFNFLRRSG